jgi:hypothetical protein
MSVFGAVTKKLLDGKQARFFSQAARSAENLQRKTGNADGFFNDLTGKGQVKPDELNAMGFKENFAGRQDVSRQEVQQFIGDNQLQIKETVLGSDQAKFGNYTLDGGDNYRELLLSNPRKPHADQGKLDDLRRSQDSEDYLADIDEPRDRLRAQNQDIENELNDLLWSEGGADLTGEKLKKSKQLKRQMQPLTFKIQELNIARDKRAMALREQIVDLQHEIGQEKRGQEFINSGHFDEPNILAHLRMKDRVDTDGNKTLLIEEAQSDWHQKGADVGYKPRQNDIVKLRDDYKKLQEMQHELNLEDAAYLNANPSASRSPDEFLARDAATYKALVQARKDLEQAENLNKVPDAPFKTDDKSSWYNLAMKRGLLEAVEGGYDKMAITTGRQQADRYDLSKQINEVRLGPGAGVYRNDTRVPTYTVSAFDKNDNPVIMQSIESLDELPNLIGKDAAKSLVDQPWTDTPTGAARILAGQDLSIGGEGMKQFYDRTLPNTLNKLVKQDGVKVGQSEILGKTPFKTEIASASDRKEILRLRDEIYNGDDTSATHDRYNELLAMYQPKPRTDTVHSIDITPEMRERVKKGLPLFAQGGAVVGAGALFSPGEARANLMDEDKKLRAMGSKAWGKVSPELAAYRRAQILPDMATLAQGAVRDTAKGLDYLSPANLTRLLLDPADEGLSRFISPPISNMKSEAAKFVTQPMLYDEDDQYSKERKRKTMDIGGMLFSPI